MIMKKCVSCGFENTDTAKYCSNCGSVIEIKSTPGKYIESLTEKDDIKTQNTVSITVDNSPKTETTAPISEDNSPKAETASPMSEDNSQKAETAAPISEDNSQKAETAAPMSEDSSQKAETAAPITADNAPKATTMATLNYANKSIATSEPRQNYNTNDLNNISNKQNNSKKSGFMVLKKNLFNRAALIGMAIMLIIGIILGYAISGKSTLKNDYISLFSEKTKLEQELAKTNSEYSSYKTKMQPYESVQLTDAQNAAEAERLRIEQENQAAAEKAAAEKAAAEKAAADAAAAKAAEEAKGYETGITYDQLARTPDNYIGKKVKFKGKVLQVIEGTSETDIRLGVNGSYDNVLYCVVPKSKTTNMRILQDDNIVIMGISKGLMSYQSTLGGTITIPQVNVDDWGTNN